MRLYEWITSHSMCLLHVSLYIWTRLKCVSSVRSEPKTKTFYTIFLSKPRYLLRFQVFFFDAPPASNSISISKQKSFETSIRNNLNPIKFLCLKDSFDVYFFPLVYTNFDLCGEKFFKYFLFVCLQWWYFITVYSVDLRIFHVTRLYTNRHQSNYCDESFFEHLIG